MEPHAIECWSNGHRPLDSQLATLIEGNEEMSTIEKGSSVLTLINIFTVEPDKQQKLISLLIDATEQTMRHMRPSCPLTFIAVWMEKRS